MTTASERLARWACQWREQGFSDDVLEAVKPFVLDWIASALAGRGTEPGRAIVAYARLQPEGSSAVLGEATGRSAEAAAFANGALSHIVEMDDVDRASVIHPGAVVIPAALALADRSGEHEGRELLSAIVAGYEAAVRFGRAVGRKHYFHFHNTSTCGVFGSAMAAGWLLGLDERALGWALGNAGTMAFGLWEFNTDGAMSKHLHAGHAAASGLRAADLAAQGFTGARAIVEGERGFFAGMAPEGDPAAVTRELGTEPLALPGVSLKPYASCRHTHAAIDAACALRERLHGRAVSRASVATYDAAIDLCDNPSPRTPYEAKFSLQYCVAHALDGAAMGLHDFDLDGTEAQALPFEVSVVSDPELTARFPRQFPARLTVALDNGQTLSESIVFPLGDPENPLAHAQLEAKLYALAAYGGVPRDEARRYLDWVRALSEPGASSRLSPALEPDRSPFNCGRSKRISG